MSMKTLAETVEELQHKGYTHPLVAKGGKLVAPAADVAFDPETLCVDEIHRFEGATDPGDMSILFAISTPDQGIKGTWSSPFGAAASPEAAEVLRALGPVDECGPAE